MFAGIDLGTTYTKTHSGIIFKSGISDKYIDMASNVMTIGNSSYAMELFNERAEYGININKSLNINTRLNYIYALYKMAEDYTEYESVIVGLPASQWKLSNIVENYKQFLNLNELIDVEVNGITKKIKVNGLNIVPEGSTAYYAMDYQKFEGRKTLLLDWGGLTLNQILFINNEIVDVDTFEDGVLKIYQEMISDINTQISGSNVCIEDMFEILTKGYYFKGYEMDIKPIIDKIAFSYCERVYKKLKLKWGVDSIKNIPLVGAGSITMEKYIKAFLPQSELQDNAQILAAKGMEYIARSCLV